MKNILRLSALGLGLASLLFSTDTALAKQDINIYINGNPIHTEAKPFIQDNRALVPVRSVTEALGYQVDWNQRDKKVSVSCPEEGTLSLFTNKKSYYFNDTKKVLEVKPVIVNNRTFVPIRVLAESFGLDVNTNMTNKAFEISISGKAPESVTPEAPEDSYIAPAPARIDTGTALEGQSIASAQQMAAFLLEKNPNPKINCSALELAQLYIIEGQKEGIRGDFAFAQAIKETGYFRYGGDVLPAQNNYAGIGTVGGGVKGAYFESPQIGVRVQIQHLKAYATKAPLNLGLVDPRYHLVSKGCAPNLEDLNGKWAVPGHGYGESIFSIYESFLSR